LFRRSGDAIVCRNAVSNGRSRHGRCARLGLLLVKQLTQLRRGGDSVVASGSIPCRVLRDGAARQRQRRCGGSDEECFGFHNLSFVQSLLAAVYRPPPVSFLTFPDTPGTPTPLARFRGWLRPANQREKEVARRKTTRIHRHSPVGLMLTPVAAGWPAPTAIACVRDISASRPP